MNRTTHEESLASSLTEAHRIAATPEDVEMPSTQRLDEYPGTPSPITPEHPPNVLALTILQSVRERQQGRKPSQSSRTQEYLREARSGGMYGNGSDADQ
jgi:hypothetical protein